MSSMVSSPQADCRFGVVAVVVALVEPYQGVKRLARSVEAWPGGIDRLQQC
jgi:hypothetical protein